MSSFVVVVVVVVSASLNRALCDFPGGCTDSYTDIAKIFSMGIGDPLRDDTYYDCVSQSVHRKSSARRWAYIPVPV